MCTCSAAVLTPSGTAHGPGPVMTTASKKSVPTVKKSAASTPNVTKSKAVIAAATRCAKIKAAVAATVSLIAASTAGATGSDPLDITTLKDITPANA